MTTGRRERRPRRWIADGYLAPAPPERLAMLRILVGSYAVAYLVIRLPHLVDVSRFTDDRFTGIGPLWSLDGPVPAPLGQTVLAITIVAGFAFVAGWRWRLAGPAFAVLFLLVTTYRNAWGQIFHTENLVALHLLVLAISPAGDALSVDHGRRSRGRPRPTDRSGSTAVAPSEPAYGWPVRLCSAVTVLTYAVSGWAKLRNGGLDWITGDVLRNQVAHDNLRKVLTGDRSSPFAGFVLRHDWLFPPMAATSMVVELAAPVALFFRLRVRALWIGAAWLFHVGVLALMAIVFPYQLVGIAYASMFTLERIPERFTSRRWGERPVIRRSTAGRRAPARPAPR